MNRRVVEVLEEVELPYYEADLCICEFFVNGKWVRSETPYIIQRTEQKLIDYVMGTSASPIEQERILALIDQYAEDRVSEREYDQCEG